MREPRTARSLIVQRVRDALDDVPGHGAVDRVRELDEARLILQTLELPGQVQGVDGDAVPTQARTRTRIERHEPERLRCRNADDFEGIQAQPAAHHRDLVDQGDVHGAKRVLEELHHFSTFAR